MKLQNLLIFKSKFKIKICLENSQGFLVAFLENRKLICKAPHQMEIERRKVNMWNVVNW